MPSLSRSGGRERELETFALKVAIVIAFAIVLGILWFVRDILILVFIAAVFAAGISPAVHRVRLLWRFYFHRNLSRGAAVMIVYLPVLVLVLSLAIFLMPRLIVETRELGSRMPALIEQNILKPAERYLPMGEVRAYLRDVELPRARLFAYVKNAATAVAGVIAILFMIGYMLIDAHRLRNTILLFYPEEERGDKRRMLIRMGNRMSSWLSGQLILSAMIGAATFVILLALRIPFALPLTIVAMLGELVPVIGPILGAVPALAIAMLHSPWQFWSLLVAAILLQKLENLFVAPRVMARKVSISPLGAFVAFMMGGTLLGIIGAIIAIPIAAIIQVAFEEAFVTRRERRLDSDRAGTLLRRVD